MRLLTFTLVLPFALIAQSPAPAAAPTPASAPAAVPTAAALAPLGRAAAWSATTQEAAATEANKKALSESQATTLTGEVIDYSCYLQLGKTGEKHRECGRKCILAGQPAGLLTTDGAIVLLMPEEHHPRRDGQVSLKEFLAAHAGQLVAATGMMRESKGVRALFVLTLDPAAAPAPAASTPAAAPKK